ncbi:MAG: hypothetical protein ABJ327_03610 [Litoreibacter sp.]
MKNTIMARDIVLYKKGVGAGVTLSDLPIPSKAKDKDQFKSTIKIVTSKGDQMNFDVFIEVAPETTTTVGQKVPRHLQGFIEGSFEEQALVGSQYEISDLIAHKGFSLVGAI